MQSLDPERLLFRLECKSVGSMYAFLEHFYQPFGCCLYSRRSRKSSCSHRDEREVTPSFDTFLLMVEAMIASNDLPQASEYLMKMEQEGHSPDAMLLDRVMKLV